MTRTQEVGETWRKQVLEQEQKQAQRLQLFLILVLVLTPLGLVLL